MFELAIGSLKVSDLLEVGVLSATLILQKLLQLLEPILLKSDLRQEVLLVLLKSHRALIHRDFLVFKPRDLSLKLRLVRFLVVGDTLESVKLFLDLVSLSHNLIVLSRGLLELPCHMINMSFQGQDLLNIILFLLLVFRDLEGCTSDLFLGVLYLGVKVLVLGTHSLDRVLEALDLETRVPVVS